MQIYFQVCSNKRVKKINQKPCKFLFNIETNLYLFIRQLLIKD